jgi:ubiquitin C-terminal hydrolase
MNDPTLAILPTTFGQARYTIIGAILHYGDLLGGHYMRARFNSGVWILFNDSLTQKTTLNEIIQHSVVLLYKLIAECEPLLTFNMMSTKIHT